MNVRIRGIYATALTELFRTAGHRVVDASAPIRDRFDDGAVRADGVRDVAIDTADDRQGVSLDGDPDSVAAARDLLAHVGVDTFVWSDPTPRGAVFDGEVTETLGGGAVLRLGSDGDREGYLPYGAADDHVAVGDTFRVQVHEPAPPWSAHRPEVGIELRAPGGVATLTPGEGTRVDSRDEAAARELAGMAELLGLEPPTGWGIVWGRAAVDADTETLERGLERAVERAEAIESAVDGEVAGGTVEGADSPREVAAPLAGAWAWFGRESRFALDDRRRDTVATMPGHHRIKAGSDAASAGVDFAEAFCEPDPDAPFPFAVVTEQFGPREGGTVRIEHGKPAGHRIVLGEGTVTELDTDGGVTVEREMTPGGSYDELDARREAGDVAVTTFKEGRWWYPTTYRDADGRSKGTYVNVCTPVEVFPDAIRYVDLHVDVVREPDGTVRRVDDDLLEEAVEAGHVTDDQATKARAVATALENAL